MAPRRQAPARCGSAAARRPSQWAACSGVPLCAQPRSWVGAGREEGAGVSVLYSKPVLCPVWEWPPSVPVCMMRILAARGASRHSAQGSNHGAMPSPAYPGRDAW
jgi:hypothetical protein